jgi:homoserine O-acetyltransferase
VYAGWGLSPAFYKKELWRVQGFSSLEDFLIGSYERGFIRSNANNLFAQSYTWQHGDVSANDVYNGDLSAALGAMKAKTILMPCTTDRYFTVRTP